MKTLKDKDFVYNNAVSHTDPALFVERIKTYPRAVVNPMCMSCRSSPGIRKVLKGKGKSQKRMWMCNSCYHKTNASFISGVRK